MGRAEHHGGISTGTGRHCDVNRIYSEIVVTVFIFKELASKTRSNGCRSSPAVSTPRNLVAWIIPKDALSSCFSTPGIT